MNDVIDHDAIKKCIAENTKDFEPRDGIRPISKLVVLNGKKYWLSKSDTHWIFCRYTGEDLGKAANGKFGLDYDDK